MNTEQQPTEVSAEIVSKLKANQKIFLMGFLGFLGVVLLVSLGVGVYRVYAKGKTDRFTTTVATVLRLPIGNVNGKRVLFSDYADDLRAITTMREYDKAKGGQGASLTDQDLSDQVLFRQVNNILVNEIATKNGIVIEDRDVQLVKTDILEKQFGSLANAETAIKERYGWTLKEFEKKVIRPFVLQNKLSDKVKSDAAALERLRSEAQAVLDQIKGGADFIVMAKQFGQDGTAINGGDLGWFGSGEMVPEFEKAAFDLKKGELSPTLVETQFGYHIVQTTDKKTEKVKDENGKTVNKATVKARHILFMFPTVDRELTNAVKSAKIKIYSKIHNPFLELEKIQP